VPASTESDSRPASSADRAPIADAIAGVQTRLPLIMGAREAIVAGHYLAAQAGFDVLSNGGNAIDAGVAAGLALGVVESEYVNFAGVAPIVVYLAATREVVTISGLGGWPKTASCELFRTRHAGEIPPGILRTVVPGAPDAWITALERYGTLSFADAAQAAIRLAREGFPMYPLMAGIIEHFADTVSQWPANAAVYLPGGAVPRLGTRFRQADLAGTLQYLADEESAHAGKGRLAGLEAARAAFYRGDVASAIVEFQRRNGGLLAAEDLAEFRVRVEPPVTRRFGPITVYSCGPWCQGPMLLQELALLEGIDLRGLGHNSTAYAHTLTEAIKLAAADREACYGDPAFVDVPLERLLSSDYAAARRRLIRPDGAWPDVPPSGARAGARPLEPAALRPRRSAPPALDTSYVCVVDRAGNAFSATPSDGSLDAPIVPGTGFAPSNRGEQAWTDPSHPSCVAPGKRPRLTPNPALAVEEGRFVMPFGSPGMDVQTQVMLQIFLNIHVFGMVPQAAVEAPRFASHGFPSSSWPHEYTPALLHVEAGIDARVSEELAALGHRVAPWPSSGIDHYLFSCCACTVLADHEAGVLHAAADPRRPAQALAR